ncbi:hypothetical protein ARC78_15205 [Stenotrophomonas pictorum JCM 9942]|uniref:Uncharacterized protein n=1 Tax=Stenotrophomonas pictorum JCM 9942 TaxID=1236960 RepID=A0A0R0ACZ8_9GAMM|nr:DUF3168 domain-containing protein [Stenotrophomonas pictorum]KRG38824.1 hypothetical protein ARC78_15205 [Stenotrophomonas pictorum JCM 9942]
MAMESPVYMLLAATPALLALVPAASIYKSGIAAENAVAPYITIQEIATTPQNYVAGRPGIDTFRPTVKVMAETEGQCRKIAELVRDALELDGHCLIADGPEQDTETRLFVHFSDWHFHINR